MVAQSTWLRKKASDILWSWFIGRKIYCNRCGAFMGYMTLVGHKRWECADCSTTDNPRAV
jgi:transposase-like protein